VTGHEFTTFYVPIVPTLRGEPAPAAVGLLATSSRDVYVERLDDHTLSLEVERGWLHGTGERIARDTTPFVVDEGIQRPGFTAYVRAVTADGRPETVDFVFDEVLEHRSTRLLYFEEGSIELFSPPPIGEVVTLESNLPGIR
jgi:hypothetical protein